MPACARCRNSLKGSRLKGVASSSCTGSLRTIHGETVVVLAGDDDILHAGVVGQLRPLLGIELRGIELPGECGDVDGRFVSGVARLAAAAGRGDPRRVMTERRRPAGIGQEPPSLPPCRSGDGGGPEKEGVMPVVEVQQVVKSCTKTTAASLRRPCAASI